MGYYAATVDRDFTIPAENVPAALAALEALGAQFPHCTGGSTLAELVEDLTCFQDCEGGPGEDFVLGYHSDKYVDCTEDVLGILAQFATEGSYVRFNGEDDCLFGFQVREGRLCSESGHCEWSLDE